MSAPMQLSLGVHLQDAATFSNFYRGQNPPIVDYLPEMLEQPGFRFVYLWGKQDSGKSHLLQASCNYAHQLQLSHSYLACTQGLEHQIERLHQLDQDLVCLDDLEQALGKPALEEALFHAFNRLRDQGKMLIITATGSPTSLPVQLADLASRLAWGLTYQLQVLNDEDKLAALIMRAQQRGLQMPDEVARYLLNRSTRRLSGLFATLDQLDEASLKEKRKLTIPFVRQALKW